MNNYRPDATQIHRQLWVGGDVHPSEGIGGRQFVGAELLGIDAIIDVRQEWSDEELCKEWAPTIAYYHIPTDDHGGDLLPEWWIDVLAAARPHIEANETVFIHCHMGVNRGPSGGFAILSELLGYSFIDAYDAIRQARPQAHVIYAEQWANMSGDPEAAQAFSDHYRGAYDLKALIASVGAIRKIENKGGYRAPLTPVEDEVSI